MRDPQFSQMVDKDLLGKFYTFNVKIDDKWQGDTPGINARAVGSTVTVHVPSSAGSIFSVS